MNHSVNKWQQNKQKCIRGSLSETERCVSWHLPSYKMLLPSSLSFLLCLPPSVALSPPSLTLAHRRVGDLERALPQTALLPAARQGQCAGASISGEASEGAPEGLNLKGIVAPFKCAGTSQRAFISKIDTGITSCHSADHSAAAKSICSEVMHCCVFFTRPRRQLSST